MIEINFLGKINWISFTNKLAISSNALQKALWVQKIKFSDKFFFSFATYSVFYNDFLILSEIQLEIWVNTHF